MKSPQEQFIAASKKRRAHILKEYAKGRTQEAIATELGITRQRVCQIIGKEARRAKP